MPRGGLAQVERVARIARFVALEALERAALDGDVAHHALVHAHVVPQLLDHLRLDVERHLQHLRLWCLRDEGGGEGWSG